MKRTRMLTIATAAVALAVLGGAAISAQDKYSLKVPGGLAFSEFRGYEDWAVVSVHRTEDLLKVVVANPVAMDAFRAGIPDNGKPFPDGSKMAKIEWRQAKSTTLPYDLPGAVYDVDFMVKDSKRFADSGGWGYAVFVHDVASKTTSPALWLTSHRRGTTPSAGSRATRS